VRRLLAIAHVSAALLLLFFFASSSHRVALALRRTTPPDPHAWVLKPEIARLLTLGENELWADVAWIRTIVYYGDGLVKNTGMPDVDKLIAEVNAVDPRFRRPYFWGSYATVFRQKVATPEEYESSVRILRRGIAVFPSDWELHWNLGIRLYFDIKRSDPDEQRRLREEGAAFIERAMHLPRAPATLAFTALAMRSKLGQRDRALRGLKEMILTTEDPAARKKLEERYAELVSDTDSQELAKAAKSDEDAWRAEAPWAPRALFHIIGPPHRSGFNLTEIARGEDLEILGTADPPDARGDSQDSKN
jgi:hypothetical protein